MAREVGERPMSGCAHMDPDQSCASCAPYRLRAALHELSLIEAETRRVITDCSTPIFQRVRNIVEMLTAVEVQRDAALSGERLPVYSEHVAHAPRCSAESGHGAADASTKSLQRECAAAEGYVRVPASDARLLGTWWTNDGGESATCILPPYGEDTPEGRALAVAMMQEHKISVDYDERVLAGARGGAHARLHMPRAVSAWGATISEAVARARVRMKEAERKAAER